MVSLDVQLYMVFIFIITGVALGIVFDIYRALIRTGKAKGWKHHVYDLFLWLISAIIVAWGLLLGNWGELRIYVLLAILLGVLFYSQLASPLFLPIFVSMVRILHKGYASIYKKISFVSVRLNQEMQTIKNWPRLIKEALNKCRK